MFFKLFLKISQIVVLKNLNANFTGKYLSRTFLTKLHALRTATLLKRDLIKKKPLVFSLEICETFKNIFWENISGWLLFVFICVWILRSFRNCLFFFFLSGFSFTNIHRQQGKGEGIFLTPLYHFHLLHRHLDISRAITAESSRLHIASSRTRTGNLWFPSANR